MASFVSGQSYLSLYNFNHINQNLLVNPASPHNYRFVIGIPGIGGTSAHFNSNSFTKDWLEKGEDPNAKLEETIRNLKKGDRLNSSTSVDGLFVGFGTKRGYWTVAAQQINEFNMTIPTELMKLLYFGNVGSGYVGNTMNMDNFNVEANVRNEYSIGYQHYIDSNFIVGGRYKYISGVANTYMDRFNVALTTDIDKWTAQTDIMLNTSGIAGIEDIDPNSFVSEGLFSRNSGMGFDLGAYYRINDRFDVSVSALNLGWIKWRKDLRGYRSQGSFEFEGTEVNYPGDDFEAGMENLLDSLGEAFSFEEVGINSYTTPLPSHFIVSGQFYLTEKHVFGVAYQGSVWNKRLYDNIGIMYNGRYSKWINIMVGYQKIDGSFNNLALGLSLRLGAFQIYALTDNTFGIMEPTQVAATNIRAGITLSFYDKPKILKNDKE
jgi:hypothetical protein